MVFRTLAVSLLFIIVSCSKPAQENTSVADSTSTATTPAPSTQTAEQKPITLTADVAARVADEVFLAMHQGLLDYSGIALREEFSINGNKFTYTLIRHNLDNAGMSTQEFSGMAPPTVEEYKAWEADTSQNKEPLVGVGYLETHYDYTAEIDTFNISGEYKAYADSPESTPKQLRIELLGEAMHKNANEVVNGEPEFSPQDIGFYNPENGISILNDEYLFVNLGEPLEFKKDQLYVKAKFKDLTDDDLQQLSKDDLSFVRNDIFASHGHTFKTSKMIDHYSQQKKYRAIVADATPLLNKFERRNVEFIKKKEG